MKFSAEAVPSTCEPLNHPGSTLVTKAAVSLLSSNTKSLHKLLGDVCRTAPKTVFCFYAPPGGCKPSIIKMPAWVVFPRTSTQQLKQPIKSLYSLLNSSLITAVNSYQYCTLQRFSRSKSRFRRIVTHFSVGNHWYLQPISRSHSPEKSTWIFLGINSQFCTAVKIYNDHSSCCSELAYLCKENDVSEWLH